MFKNNTFSVLRFLLIFFILTVAFYGYIGVVSPGGKFYSSFLNRYADFPSWLSYLITQCAKGLLQICGYDVYQKAANNVTIRGSRGVTIIWACLGFGVMSYWVAFVAAHASNWKRKAGWIVAGISLITGINILRIVLIALANHYHWKAVEVLEPHFVFNVVSYIAIGALTIWFIYRYNKYRKDKKAARAAEE